MERESQTSKHRDDIDYYLPAWKCLAEIQVSIEFSVPKNIKQIDRENCGI